MHPLDAVTEIVLAYLNQNSISVVELPDLIRCVYSTVMTLNSPGEPVQELKPAVPVKKSITPDYLICLEDGKKLKMLKRHLMSNYNMTPDQYRAKWGLPADYPMVAPNYAKSRSELAVKLGLGKGVTGRPRLVQAA